MRGHFSLFYTLSNALQDVDPFKLVKVYCIKLTAQINDVSSTHAWEIN